MNATFQSMLLRNNIHFYTSENDEIKAAVVERYNRTLKERIYRYFTHANTRRYVYTRAVLGTQNARASLGG